MEMLRIERSFNTCNSSSSSRKYSDLIRSASSAMRIARIIGRQPFEKCDQLECSAVRGNVAESTRSSRLHGTDSSRSTRAIVFA